MATSTVFLQVDRELRRRVYGFVMLAASLLLLFGPDLALAQEGGEGVTTRLRYENVDGDRIPIEGGRVTVAGPDGEVIGEGFSDAEGNVEIPVPGPGTSCCVTQSGSRPRRRFWRARWDAPSSRWSRAT